MRSPWRSFGVRSTRWSERFCFQLVADEAAYGHRQQFRAATEEGQFDHERAPYYLAAKLANELARRVRRTPGSEEIVYHKHTLTLTNRVDMQLQPVRSRAGPAQYSIDRAGR